MAYGKPISVLTIDKTNCYSELDFADLREVYVDDEGKEYVVVKFGEALVLGDVVSFTSVGSGEVTKLGVGGFAGVVLGSVEANTYGVVQRRGLASVKVPNLITAGTALKADGSGSVSARATATDDFIGVALEDNSSGAVAVKYVELR